MDVHYAAGLFEGEGNVTSYKTRATAQIAMTDLEPLERFQSAVGMGRAMGPYGPYQPNRKAFWRWAVTSQVEVVRLGELLSPLLSPRRRLQFEAVVIQGLGRNRKKLEEEV